MRMFEHMSTHPPLIILGLVVLAVGCSSQPKHVTGPEFENLFKSRNVQTLRWYAYFGETNGAVYMIENKTPLVGSNPKKSVFFTETNGLTPGFLDEMRRLSWLEQNGASNWGQPFRSATNGASGAVGSRL